MPTGYTAKLLELDNPRLSDFMRICAPAFGAFIMFRESDVDPRNLPAESGRDCKYERERMERAKAEVERISSMSPEERLEESARKASEEYSRALKDRDNNAAENLKYNAVLASMNHNGPIREALMAGSDEQYGRFREFMQEQLNASMNRVEWCDESVELAKAWTLDPHPYALSMLKRAEEELERAEIALIEEEKRRDDANEWIAGLLRMIAEVEKSEAQMSDSNSLPA